MRSRRVAAARKLLRPGVRRAEGRILVEGPQALSLAAARLEIVELFVTQHAADRHSDLVADLHRERDRITRSIADLQTSLSALDRAIAAAPPDVTHRALAALDAE